MGRPVDNQREELEIRLRYLGIQAIALEHRKIGYMNALRKTEQELIENDQESIAICQQIKNLVTFEEEVQ